MPRKALVKSDVLPYHVTARANNRQQFPAELQLLWEVFGNELLLLSILHEVRIHAFVLMPNHFHLLLTVPQEDLGKIMNLLMSNVTRELNRKIGRSGHIFGGPYYWSLISSFRYFGHALKYIYRNPVKAQLCSHVQEYPFSTIRGIIGADHLPFPISFTRVAMELNLPEVDQHFKWLEWLNEPFPAEAETLIQASLKKKKIDQIIDRKTRMPPSILTELL